MTEPSALRTVLDHAYAYWRSAIFASALRHRIFDHIAQGATTPEAMARAANISPRGSQALLDGLVGLELLIKSETGYANSQAATDYLLSANQDYLGGYADLILATLPDWSRLPEAVASGRPLRSQERADPNNTFWEHLVPALAPLCIAPALAVAKKLRIAERNGIRMLDIGGGAGAYSAIWLGLSPSAHCSQIDWPNVNVLARRYVADFGNGDRFTTIDGDMERIALPDAEFDCIIYSNVAHALSPVRNIEMFRRIKRWLKRDGVLVISNLIPNDERTGDSLLMMSSVNLLLNSEEGALYLREDYSRWLKESGFGPVEFEALSDLPITLIYSS